MALRVHGVDCFAATLTLSVTVIFSRSGLMLLSSWTGRSTCMTKSSSWSVFMMGRSTVGTMLSGDLSAMQSARGTAVYLMSLRSLRGAVCRGSCS